MLSLLLGMAVVDVHAADRCREGASALSDAKAIAAVRGAIARQCPCASFTGANPNTKHGAFVRCATDVIDDATDGSPLLNAFSLRRECRREVRKIYTKAACGYPDPRPA
jgi:hypothetical protein